VHRRSVRRSSAFAAAVGACLVGLVLVTPAAGAATGSEPNDPSFAVQWGLENIGQAVNGTAGRPGADASASAADRKSVV